MDSAWVLRSPHVDGVHLVVRALPGAHETLARLVSWAPAGGASGLVDVLDATMLPAGIQAVSWCGSDASSPVRLATCSAETLHVVDLAYHTHPRRVRSSFKPDGVGALCAGVAWAGGSGRLVVFALGGSVHALDAETSARVWSFPAGGNKEIPSAAPVASLAAIDEQTVVASWSASSSDAGDAGSIHLLDLRAPPTPAQRTAVASGTAAVHGLCAAPLEPNLVASHAETEGHSEVFVWDVRSRCRSQRSVSLLHGGGVALTLEPLQTPVGLEWSPAKSGTLLAVSTGGPAGASVQACRLWPLPEANGSLEQQPGNGLSVDSSPTSWVGEARTMRLVPPPHDGNTFSPDGDTASASCSDIVAAGWAHNSRPGMALALRNGGALVALEQRSARLAAWSPRGGAAVVRQWPAAAPAGSEPREPPKNGLPAVLDDSEKLAATDVCWVMRERVERFHYGAQKQSFDEYSRIVRATGRHAPAIEALALMWQWAKLADAASGVEQEVDPALLAAPQLWKGVQMTLSQDEQDQDEASEPFRGVPVYSSPGRRRSLQALGFPEVETAPSLADSGSPQVDDAVRRILRAILWLQFDKAATDCDLLEPHCGASARLLLPQLVLVFHSATCILAGAVRDVAEEEGTVAARKASDPTQASSAALSASVHAFRATAHNLLDLNWHDLPSASTLRLALRFVNVAVTACTVALPLSAAPGSDMGGVLAHDTFEDTVRALLSSGTSDGAGGLRGDGGAAAAPASGAFAAGGESSGSARPSLALRCGLALRFLPKASLDAAMDAIFGECARSGLPEGLCALGLGGADGTPPFTAGMLEELSADSAALPPPLPLSPSSTRRSNSMPSMGPLAELGDRGSAPAGGLVDGGASLIGTYVAWTGDVQSAALLFCHSAHLLQPPLGLRRCFAQYAALLARWQLYKQRAGLHSLLTARLPLDEPSRSRGPVVFCAYCNGPLTGPLPSLPGSEADAILRRCPNANCSKATPSCAVCLLPIFVIRSRPEDPDRASKQSARLAVDSWVAWCQGCHHGGHIAHLEEWFATHNECPVAGCDCRCALY